MNDRIIDLRKPHPAKASMRCLVSNRGIEPSGSRRGCTCSSHDPESAAPKTAICKARASCSSCTGARPSPGELSLVVKLQKLRMKNSKILAYYWACHGGQIKLFLNFTKTALFLVYWDSRAGILANLLFAFCYSLHLDTDEGMNILLKYMIDNHLATQQPIADLREKWK